jgi:ribonuclease PH
MARAGGRKSDELRSINITTDYIKYPEGSCLIELGDTKVVCTASVEELVPPFLRGSGNGWVTAEYGMLPRSCSSRIQRGKDSGRTYEIQRLVGRSLRAVTDTHQIGERTIWIDCDVIQGDGGTRTASITGSFIALCLALGKLKAGSLIKEIPVDDFVAATSVGMLRGDLAIDLDYMEDSQAEVDMNIVMTGRGELIEVQGTAERRTFSREQMNQMLSMAKKGIEGIVEIQRRALKNHPLGAYYKSL